MSKIVQINVTRYDIEHGVIGDACYCPIALALSDSDLVEEGEEVHVENADNIYVKYTVGGNEMTSKITLTEDCLQIAYDFIGDFDCCPSLIEGSSVKPIILNARRM